MSTGGEGTTPLTNPSLGKKHKRHKYEKSGDEGKYGFGPGGGSSSGNGRLKLILKVGGSSTPEHSDSPGPTHPHVLNVPYDEDSRNSVLSVSYSSLIKKAKKKEKKKKKDKKHKHHHKEKKKRDKSEHQFPLSETLMEVDPPHEKKLFGPITNPPATATVKQEVEVSAKIISSFDEGIPTEGAREQQRSCVARQRSEKASLQKLLEHLLRTLEKKDPQQFFAWPVTDKIAPGYSDVISKPMDFSAMHAKVNAGEYSTLMEFTEDFKLMCNNAMTYNHPDTVYYKTAKKLLQGGLKVLDEDKIRALVPLMPSIRILQEEQLGFPLFQDHSDSAGPNLTEDEFLEEPVCMDPTKSIHYVPPHPNDPPDLCGAFTDDLTPEEVLQQARLAARDAAHRLAAKKPNSSLGFLRQREDGSTSLAILTPSCGTMPGTKERPISLGALTGKIPHGTTQFFNQYREDKRARKPLKPLYYGPYCSYAPYHDSSFANLNEDETELVQATYGDDNAVEYAESIIEFAKGCDYAMIMVDEVLDTLTKGEHTRTINILEERKRMEKEEAELRRQEEEIFEKEELKWKAVEDQLGVPAVIVDDSEKGPADPAVLSVMPIDYDAVKSLQGFGIDTSFVDGLKPSLQASVTGKLQENAELITNLEKVQKSRLSQPIQSYPPYVQPPSEDEYILAHKITENLIDLAKQAKPADVSSVTAIRKAMGVDLDTFQYTPATRHPQEQPVPPITDQTVASVGDADTGGQLPEVSSTDENPTSSDLAEMQQMKIEMEVSVSVEAPHEIKMETE